MHSKHSLQKQLDNATASYNQAGANDMITIEVNGSDLTVPARDYYRNQIIDIHNQMMMLDADNEIHPQADPL